MGPRGPWVNFQAIGFFKGKQTKVLISFSHVYMKDFNTNTKGFHQSLTKVTKMGPGVAGTGREVPKSLAGMRFPRKH